MKKNPFSLMKNRGMSPSIFGSFLIAHDDSHSISHTQTHAHTHTYTPFLRLSLDQTHKLLKHFPFPTFLSSKLEVKAE